MRCMCKYFQCRSLIPRFSCVASLQVTLPLTHLLRLPSGCHNIWILNRLCQASIGQSGILILFCFFVCTYACCRLLIRLSRSCCSTPAAGSTSAPPPPPPPGQSTSSTNVFRRPQTSQVKHVKKYSILSVQVRL